MASSFRYVAGLVAFAILASAKVSSRLPQATTTFNFPFDQFVPQPTKAPVYGDLRKRQSTSEVTVLVAPDNTCGYISGRAGAEYTCGGTATCALMPAVDSTIPGRVACCGAKNCNAPRTCYDYKDIYTSSLCDSGCRVDTETRKCTETAQPFCRTVSFSDDIYGYWCASEENSTPQAVSTTYAGQRARQWSEVVVTLGDTTSSSDAGPTGSTATASSGRETSTAPVSGPEPSKPSSTPIGAIVGGVVGGVAVIALAVFGIWFLIRKKNHNGGPQGQQQQQQQQPPPPQMSYAQPPQGSPSQYAAATTNTQTSYDPKFGGPSGYPQTYGGTPPPPPPQDGYQQPYFAAGNVAPDRADTTSPGAVSQMTNSNSANNMNNRYSMQPVSPHTTQGGLQQFGQAPPPPPPQQQQQPQQPPPTIHEAPTTADGHRGHMHELA